MRHRTHRRAIRRLFVLLRGYADALAALVALTPLLPALTVEEVKGGWVQVSGRPHGLPHSLLPRDAHFAVVVII